MGNLKNNQKKHYEAKGFNGFDFDEKLIDSDKGYISERMGSFRKQKVLSDNGNIEKYCFFKKAMTNLSVSEQLLFEKFGKGEQKKVSHNIIHQAFEEQAQKNPELIAATHLGNAITYKELNRQSSDLAFLLTELGVSKGDNVALFLQRSIPMLVGMLAILKAGACYVPQDINVSPIKQQKHIIDVASVNVVLTLSYLENKLPKPTGCKVIAVDEFMTNSLLFNNSQHSTNFNPKKQSNENDNCFLLFTSGTTGKPNGVQVTHGNLCNIVLSNPGSLGIKAGTKVSQILNIAFDMAAWEIWACLGHGGTLIIRDKKIESAVQFAEVVVATPTILGTLDAKKHSQVRVVAVAGEPCPRPLADTWGSFCTFYNSCGPTETTIVNTMSHHLPSAKQLTIGKPTPNNTVYILDKKMRPCKIGEVGEMWAGGRCVSAGYLNNSELNKKRYFLDPFLGNEQRMFKTGDLARWTEDGELEPFGRVDDQIKIRGFRVELDSVSSSLESVNGCNKALTLKLNESSLVAFVTPSDVDTQLATETVTSTLPYYCVPKFIIPMNEFLMTERGKVDKRKMLKIALEQEMNDSQTEDKVK